VLSYCFNTLMGLSRRFKNTRDLVAMMVDEVGYPALFIDRSFLLKKMMHNFQKQGPKSNTVIWPESRSFNIQLLRRS